MGFFDVVAPSVLSEVEKEMQRKKSVVSPGGGGQRSFGASEDVPPGQEEDDFSSSGDRSQEEAGTVGLFDAMEGEALPAVGSSQLVDKKLLTVKTKGQTALPFSESTLFKSDGSAVLGIVNYGEDKVITHETDCIRVWDFASKKVLLKFDVQVRRFRKYNHWLFCVDTDSEDILQLDLRDTELKPNRFTGLEEEATAIAVNNFVGFGVTLFAITKDSYSYSWRCPPVEAEGHDVEISTRFKGHTQNVTSLDLGDRYLYTSSTDKTVRVWNYENGSCVMTLNGHTDWVFSVKVIGQDVYSGSRDETVRVWNAKGECTSIIKIGALAYGVILEEEFLYIRDAMKRVLICEAKKGNKIVGTAEGSAGNVRGVIIYKNVMVTSADNDTNVRVWSADDGAPFAVLKSHSDQVNGIALFGAGVILSGGEDGTVRQWDLKKVFEGFLVTSTAAEVGGGGGGGFGGDTKSPRMSLMKGRSGSIFKKRSSSEVGTATKERRGSIFGKLGRSESLGSRLSIGGGGASGPSADVPTVTPALIVSMQRALKPVQKTQKVKGQFYPSALTGKELIGWIKTNVQGCDSSKTALAVAITMQKEGAFEVVTGKEMEFSADANWTDLPEGLVDDLYAELNPDASNTLFGDGNFSFTGNSPYMHREADMVPMKLEAPIAEADIGSDIPGREAQAPQRKRRAPDEVQLAPPSVGRLEISAQQMESFLVQRSADGSTCIRARDELYRFTQLCKQLIMQLEHMRQAQYAALKGSSSQMLPQLQQQANNMAMMVKNHLNLIDGLNDVFLLEPLELFQVKFLMQQFRVLSAHVNALLQELQWASNNKPLEPYSGRFRLPFFGSLLIREQPDALVAFKGKSLDEPFVVEVVCGVSEEVQVSGNMVCELLSMGDDATMKVTKKLLENNEAFVDGPKKTACFQHIRPTISTRMQLCCIQFQANVVVGTNNTPVPILSDMSEPLVIITHDSQWHEAETKLILVHAFRNDQKTVSWQRFANLVHSHYLRATKQDIRNASRRLALSDFHYFFNRFFAAHHITQSQCSKFLSWFAPVVQQMRFKKHIRPMWFSGLIFGFLDKERCNQTLSSLPEGTFLIRFSESSPGQFAVAYVSDDVHERVKHYLVKPEDLVPNKTLPDFIRGKPQWLQLLRIDLNTNAITKQHKDVFLAQYYSNDPSQQPKKNGAGYVLL